MIKGEREKIRLFNDASISTMICVKTQNIYTVYIIAKTWFWLTFAPKCSTLGYYNVRVFRDNVPHRLLCSCSNNVMIKGKGILVLYSDVFALTLLRVTRLHRDWW